MREDIKRALQPMKRRAFITLLGGAAAAWPLAAGARQFSAQCYTRGAHKSECYGA